MRKSYFCIIVASLFILALITACGQTGTNNPAGITGGPGEIVDNSNGLVGTWYYVNEDNYDYKYEDYLTFNPNGEFDIQFYLYSWDYYNNEWELVDYGSMEGVYEVNGNQLIMEFDDNGYYQVIIFTFVIEGDELTLISTEGYSVTYIRYYGGSSNNQVTNSDPDIPVIETNLKTQIFKGLVGILKQN